MAGKLSIVCCLLVTVLVVQVSSQSCPSYFSAQRGTCHQKRCIVNKDCPADLICCRVRICGRRCVVPLMTEISDRPEDIRLNGGIPAQRFRPVEQEVVHAGSCNVARNIFCRGKFLCQRDSQCREHEKCCTGQCGRKVCVTALKSSSSVLFQGK